MSLNQDVLLYVCKEDFKKEFAYSINNKVIARSQGSCWVWVTYE